MKGCPQGGCNPSNSLQIHLGDRQGEGFFAALTFVQLPLDATLTNLRGSRFPTFRIPHRLFRYVILFPSRVRTMRMASGADEGLFAGEYHHAPCE